MQGNNAYPEVLTALGGQEEKRDGEEESQLNISPVSLSWSDKKRTIWHFLHPWHVLLTNFPGFQGGTFPHMDGSSHPPCLPAGRCGLELQLSLFYIFFLVTVLKNPTSAPVTRHVRCHLMRKLLNVFLYTA